MKLENEAEQFVPFFGELVVSQTGDELMIDRQRPAVRTIEQSEDIKERTFAATRWTDDGVDSTGFEIE